MADQKPNDRLPTSRIGRLARLAGLSQRTIPFAIEGAKRALGVQRSDEDRAKARVHMHAEAKKTAEALLTTLGEMKGCRSSSGRWRATSTGSCLPATKNAFRKR